MELLFGDFGWAQSHIKNGLISIGKFESVEETHPELSKRIVLRALICSDKDINEYT